MHDDDFHCSIMHDVSLSFFGYQHVHTEPPNNIDFRLEAIVKWIFHSSRDICRQFFIFCERSRLECCRQFPEGLFVDANISPSLAMIIRPNWHNWKWFQFICLWLLSGLLKITFHWLWVEFQLQPGDDWLAVRWTRRISSRIMRVHFIVGTGTWRETEMRKKHYLIAEN